MSLRYSLLALAVLSASSQAAGFKIFEQSTSSMGNAYAGRTALAEDATVVYSNPAAMTELDQAQWIVGANAIFAQADWSNARGQNANGQAVAGPASDDFSSLSVVPHLYYYQPINEQWHAGLALVVPYGVTSDYDDDFVGRYFADKTSFQVVSLQPALAYKVNDAWSLGLGLSVNFAQGELSKFKDHSGLCEMPAAALNGQYAQLSGGAYDSVYQDAFCESRYRVKGDDWGLGLSLGLHYRPSDALQLGMNWHSQVHYSLEGDSTITNTPVTGELAPQALVDAGILWVAPTIPGVVDGSKLPTVNTQTGQLAVNSQMTESSRLSLTTPQSVAFSGAYQLGKWTYLASANWTEWSKFQSIRIESTASTPSISASTSLPSNLNETGLIGYIPEKWQNAWAFALGVNYQLNPDLVLRAGYALDQSPVRDEFRTARIPTSDRQWFTLGLGWELSPAWHLDLAYGYMKMDDVKVDEREFNAQDQALYSSGYQADYELDAHVLSAQLVHRF